MPTIIQQDFIYSRIGMALTSAQRVEFVAGQLLNHLTEFDKDIYGITTLEFLDKAAKSKGKRTLGAIFQILKLNPKLVIEEEIDDYLQKRNLLAHSFWVTFLQNGSDGKDAIAFCYDFGLQSNRIESFFKGFLYFLALRHVKDEGHIEEPVRSLKKDFDFFIRSLKQTRLKDSETG